MKKHPFLVVTEGYRLDTLPAGRWRLTSPTGHVYEVDPEAGTCNCADFRSRGHRRACKHLTGVWALLRLVPDLLTLTNHREV